MVEKRKPAIRTPRIHECNQAERLTRHGEILERTSKILYGNGNPKDGLVFRFDEFMSGHKRLVDDITSIKMSIDKAIESARTAAHAVELFKVEEIAKDTTKDDIEKKQQIADELKARIKREGEDRELVLYNLKAKRVSDHWQRIIWIVMAVIAVCSIWTAIYISNKEVIKKVERKEGVSKVTRGGYVPYVEGVFIDSIKLK